MSRPTAADAGLSEGAAEWIYQILVTFFGVHEDDRADFVRVQTREFVSEYRVGGLGGFGGKFWRATGTRADGTYGEKWLVNAYPEDETPERRAAIDATNAALTVAQEQCERNGNA